MPDPNTLTHHLGGSPEALFMTSYTSSSRLANWKDEVDSSITEHIHFCTSADVPDTSLRGLGDHFPSLRAGVLTLPTRSVISWRELVIALLLIWWTQVDCCFELPSHFQCLLHQTLDCPEKRVACRPLRNNERQIEQDPTEATQVRWRHNAKPRDSHTTVLGPKVLLTEVARIESHLVNYPLWYLRVMVYLFIIQ